MLSTLSSANSVLARTGRASSRRALGGRPGEGTWGESAAVSPRGSLRAARRACSRRRKYGLMSARGRRRPAPDREVAVTRRARVVQVHEARDLRQHRPRHEDRARRVHVVAAGRPRPRGDEERRDRTVTRRELGEGEGTGATDERARLRGTHVYSSSVSSTGAFEIDSITCERGVGGSASSADRRRARASRTIVSGTHSVPKPLKTSLEMPPADRVPREARVEPRVPPPRHHVDVLRDRVQIDDLLEHQLQAHRRVRRRRRAVVPSNTAARRRFALYAAASAAVPLYVAAARWPRAARASPVASLSLRAPWRRPSRPRRARPARRRSTQRRAARTSAA